MTNFTDASFVRNTSNDIAEPSKILNNLVVIPFGIPICLENVLAIIVLMKSSRLIYQVRILSINLAITDCLAGFFLSVPDNIYGDCPLKKYFAAPFINVSLITVTLFNIDRCCSLKFALRYYEIVTPKVLKIACLLSWLAGIVITYLMFFDPSHPLGIFCGMILRAPMNAVSYPTKVLQVLTILSNLMMYIYMSMSIYVKSRNSNTNNGLSMKNQIMVVKKLSIITGFFLVCCTPYFLTQIIPNVDFYSSTFMRSLAATIAGIMFLNSAINPILYVWRFTESRYQLKRMIYCLNVDKLRELEGERNKFFATYVINTSSSDSKSYPS